MNPVQTFLQKIDQVIALVGSESEAEEIKTNLLSSLYLDLTTKIGLDPRNKQFLDEMAAKSPKTVEEFEQAIVLAQEKLKTTGFDTNQAVMDSSKAILESFISKVEPQLPPQKVEELKKIVAE
jgi:hypothetical protein